MENLFNSFQNNHWFFNVLIIGGILWFIIDTFFLDMLTKDDSKYKVQKRKDGKYILTNKATGEAHIINAKDSLKYGIRIKGVEYNSIEKNDLSDKVNKQNNSKGNENVSEEDYYVKDTVTGKVLKVSKEKAKKVAKDYIEHKQSEENKIGLKKNRG